MKRILIAHSAGYCFGVKRAISIAHKAAAAPAVPPAREMPFYSLGPLIHNPQAVAKLAQQGVHVVESVDQVSCGKVIVRSHGITRPDHEALVAKGIRIVDATCPFVTKAQEHARFSSQEGYAVILVGDPNHPEVKGIVSHVAPGAPILTSLTEIEGASGVRKACVVAQTTQSFETLMQFAAAAIRKFSEVRVFNTICHATVLRQRESSGMARKTDAMIVLGGYNSANTRRLAELCRQINPRTYHIETAAELTGEMLDGTTCVGVTAGASTPPWIIDELVDKVQELWSGEEVEVAHGPGTGGDLA